MTDKTQAALKLALEALESWGKGFPDNWGDLDTEAITAIREALAEQPAIKQDLTPEQTGHTFYDGNGNVVANLVTTGDITTDYSKPSVWVTPKLRPLAKLAHEQHQCKFPMCHNEEYQQALAEQLKRELYTGESAQQQQEPVAHQYSEMHDDGTWSAWVGCDKPLLANGWRRVRDLYTSPPASKPLTDEEIEFIRVDQEFTEWAISKAAFRYAARAIEAAHGIKGDA